MRTLAAIALCAIAAVALGADSGALAQELPSVLSRVDHLVYAGPDLDAAVDRVQKLIGVRATSGGQHPGRGTRNALVALGPSGYLEIIGPDPAQPAPNAPRTFGIDRLNGPRLVTWAAKGQDLEEVRRTAVTHGVTLGDVGSGSRKRPDGVLLSWRYTSPLVLVEDGLVPFFIDWGSSPHPSRTAATGATLVELRAEHPEATRVQGLLRQLGLDLRVTAAPTPALVAVIAGPAGRVELR